MRAKVKHRSLSQASRGLANRHWNCGFGNSLIQIYSRRPRMSPLRPVVGRRVLATSQKYYARRPDRGLQSRRRGLTHEVVLVHFHLILQCL